jgi:hypothetical protein
VDFLFYIRPGTGIVNSNNSNFNLGKYNGRCYTEGRDIENIGYFKLWRIYDIHGFDKEGYEAVL